MDVNAQDQIQDSLLVRSVGITKHMKQFLYRTCSNTNTDPNPRPRFRKYPNTIVQPLVDGIDKDSMAYGSNTGHNFHVGVFGWDLK